MLAGPRKTSWRPVRAVAFAAVAFAPVCGGRAQSGASPLMRPVGVAYDSAGDLFVADAARNQVFEISAGGVVTVVAGDGTQGFAGDGGAAGSAELNAPAAVAVAADGTVYIADTGNERVRAVQGGRIATIAGNGVRGFSGDGGAAAAASLNGPAAIAIDASGALLVCDRDNARVRRISAGVIQTLAGDGVQGFAGDGGAATAAELNEPSGVAASADGRIFIADTGNQRVRVMSAGGVIATFAGRGVAGSSGDGAAAAAAQLNRPMGLAMDAAGELFVADQNNHRVRRIAADGTITTIAGSGLQGAPADGAVAVSAQENLPVSAAVSSFGWPVVSDAGSGTLRILFGDGRQYSPAGMSGRTTSLSVNAPNAVYGSAQSAVSVAGSPGTVQGVVQVADSGRVIASGSLAQGAATIALPALAAGTHTLTATYAGDGLHPSSSATAMVAVQPAPVTATAAAATVSYGAPLPVLTGTLTGVLPQDAGSVSAVFASSAPAMAPVGNYPMTARLTGAASGNYAVSMAGSSGALTVVPAATVAMLAQPTTVYATLPLELTARVASTTSGTPTGTVEFLDAGSVIATASLVNGTASAVELNPVSGQHALSVVYSGDTNFHGSTSANVVAAVNALPDFTVAVAGSSQQTVIAGSAASYGLKVGSQGTPFTGAVTLSASGLPAGASVSFSPPTVVPGASTAVVTMTVTTATTSAQGMHGEAQLALVLAGGLLLAAAPRRRRLTRLLSVLALAGVFGLAGCGARTASESVLPVRSFAIQVQATGTNLAGNVVVHTVAVTLGVE